MKKIITTSVSLLLVISAFSQWAGKTYFEDPDPLVQKKLEEWQDLKLGFFVHWGAYSVESLCESWPVVSEDVDWLTPHANLKQFRDHYFNNLPKQFNPTKFDPDQWADLAKDMGAKYFVFTTKHHDGFSMWDTKQTDYKITNPNYPYSKSKHADIAGALFNSMRNKGMMIGAYISKPDWHSPYYWSPSFDTAGRNVNYKINRHPEWWKKYTDFFYNQVEELMTEYGNVDILWLDGAWATKSNKAQDMQLDSVGLMCRKHQPGILVVDRWCGGRWENYRTPEQHIPTENDFIPWESCMTVGNTWSYMEKEKHWKDGRELTHKLIDVVAKGGNLLLNLGGSPDGWFHPKGIKAVREMGAWLELNGKAIYGTRAIAPFNVANVRYTRSKDSKTIYAIVLLDQEEIVTQTMLPGCLIDVNAEVKDVSTGKKVEYTRQGNSTIINVPQKSNIDHFAIAFEISSVEKMNGKKYEMSEDAENALLRNKH